MVYALISLTLLFVGCEAVAFKDKDKDSAAALSGSDDSFLTQIDLSNELDDPSDSPRASYVQKASAPLTVAAETALLKTTSLSAVGTSELSSMDKILVIADAGLYYQVQDRIDRYLSDINYGLGVEVDFAAITGGSAEDLKSIIVNRYAGGLDGVVLIGNLPAAWFQFTHDLDYQWACDLYFMDVDGVWEDLSGDDGIYDSHTGNIAPEIFVGRIDTAHMGVWLDEVEGMEMYLDKDHSFWTGEMQLRQRSAYDFRAIGLDYTLLTSIYGEENTDLYMYNTQEYTRENFFNALTDPSYEYAQIVAHSSSSYHSIVDGVTSADIYDAGAQAVGYQLYACSVGNWPAYTTASSKGYMAGSYIYSPYSRSLFVTAGTDPGGMQNREYFFDRLGEGQPVGQAFKNWWVDAQAISQDVNQHYGLTILGDPLVGLKYTTPDRVVVYETGVPDTILFESSTVQTAVDFVASLSDPDAGYTVYADSGIYIENVVIDDIDNLTLIGSGAVLEGHNLTGASGILLDNASNIEIRGFDIENYAYGILSAAGVEGTVITENDISSCTVSGIYLNAETETVVVRNILHDNTHGLTARHTSDSLLVHNTVLRNTSDGFHLPGVQVTETATCLIINNIFAGNGYYDINNYLGDLSPENNLYDSAFRALNGGTSNLFPIYGDALLDDDFSISAASSPAVDSGVITAGSGAYNCAAPDLGAIESEFCGE